MRPRDYIGYGAETGITLSELARVSGTNERLVRKDIEEARTEGEMIVNYQDGAGYFRTDDLDELTRFWRQEHARAVAIHKRNSPLYKKLKEAGRI